MGEVPGEFVALLGPGGLAASGAGAAGGSAAPDVVDVDQPLVLVEVVGILMSAILVLLQMVLLQMLETLLWLRFLDGGVLVYRAGLNCGVRMRRSTAARRSSAGRFLAEW